MLDTSRIFQKTSVTQFELCLGMIKSISMSHVISINITILVSIILDYKSHILLITSMRLNGLDMTI